MGKRRGPGKRAQIEIAHRHARVAELYLQGRKQHEIAQDLDVGESTVTKDLEAIQKAWLEACVRDITQQKMQEVAKIDHLERTYWAEWERSKLPARKSRTQKVTQGASPEKATAQVETQERCGKRDYLRGVEWCIERRIKLLGLDAPQQVDLGAGVVVLTGVQADLALGRRKPDTLPESLPDSLLDTLPDPLPDALPGQTVLLGATGNAE